MSDKETVINCLQLCDGRAIYMGHGCEKCSYLDGTESGEKCIEHLHADALAILLEQEAIKVVRVQNIQTTTYDWGEETEVRADFYCPACKRLVASGYSAQFPYCPWCGREVKWE